jgi:hypothetical protein
MGQKLTIIKKKPMITNKCLSNKELIVLIQQGLVNG